LDTRGEVAEFAAEAYRNLDRIGRGLRAGSFKFPPALGIAVKKKTGAKKRPIVKSPIPSRIVQRAILDVVQQLPGIEAKLSRRFNFGGVEGLGVPEAIREAYKASITLPYYIRSDIKSFFDSIPRDLALKKITQVTNEPQFDQLLKEATDTELANLVQLGRDGDLFPLQEIGVAQGSCLSPLLCNLLLEDFDSLMNAKGIICIRYIDDFILFAKNEKYAFKALGAGRANLKRMNLDLYDPLEAHDKAEHGYCRNGFEFLGCEVRPGQIRPSAKSRKRLIAKLSDVFADSVGMVKRPKQAALERKAYTDTLNAAGNIIRGWGNTYSFCTDDRLMADVDRHIDTLLTAYNERFRRAISRTTSVDKRRLLGLFLVSDCNKDVGFRELVKLSPQSP